jgi:hypothetical protein
VQTLRSVLQGCLGLSSANFLHLTRRNHGLRPKYQRLCAFRRNAHVRQPESESLPLRDGDPKRVGRGVLGCLG